MNLTVLIWSRVWLLAPVERGSFHLYILPSPWKDYPSGAKIFLRSQRIKTIRSSTSSPDNEKPESSSLDIILDLTHIYTHAIHNSQAKVQSV